MDELVTLIIPVLNREDTLPRLFASLRRVTYEPLEVIFVDNGSTDRSVAMCSDFGGTLLHCHQRGAAAARNVGLRASHGTYVSFFDSDDEMSPTFIADLVALLRDGAELAVARTRSVFASGREMVRAVGGHTVAAHIIAQGLNTASWVARTDLLRRAGGWDETLLYWDDYELGVRLLLHSRATAWSDEVYHRTYEYDGHRLTTTAGQTRVERSRQALDAVERDLRDKPSALNDKALRLRRAIVRGQLERDGMQADNIECRGALAHALRFYTRWGGRGAWRVALWCCRKA